MLYHSTRNSAAGVSSARAVLQGLAPDGGLYVPQRLPDPDPARYLSGDVYETASAVLSDLLPDIPDPAGIVRRAYGGKFQTADLTPTVQAGPFTVLELFRGPTSAFKDVALSVLPHLLAGAKAVCREDRDILILTATSGDTGKAALEGFRDVPGTRICVFYPKGGVSGIQRAQMATQEGRNVTVCAVEGNFDDAQSGVKAVFSACRGRDMPVLLSSANSINIGRLAPQLVYYFRAYRDLLDRGTIRMGDPVNFAVPTGNFGDILAGFLAKELGLPVGRLICASNANNVLTDFIRTGVYDRRRTLHKTISPSMDILVSSNLERLLYLLGGEDTALVAELMARLDREGRYAVPEALLRAIQAAFWAGCCDDEQAQATIRRVWTEYGYLCDPHTAAGWTAAEEYRAETGDGRPMVVLSTASPFKFPAAVLEALGRALPEDEFDRMDALAAYTGMPIPESLSALREKAERHTGVIHKDRMLEYVLDIIKERS